MLSYLGLSPAEELVYRELVSAGALTAPALARACHGELADVVSALHAMRRAGLVAERRDPEGVDLWEAAPPSLGLGALLAVRQDELRSLAGEITELDSLYREGSGRRGDGGALEVLHGRETIRHRFFQLQHSARSELISMRKGRPIAVTGAENVGDQVALTRGVRARLLVDPAALARDTDALFVAVGQGMDIRIASEVPSKLLVVDRDRALLPLHADPERMRDRAVIVYASGIVAALVGLFDQTWAMSRPLREEVRGDDDATVLSLMLGGLTDEAIAQRLGASARTVQRRIKRLMERAGASTRFQLGWHAREMGWVSGSGQPGHPPPGPGFLSPDDPR